MDRKKVESSNLCLLRLKSICVATREFDFYKLTIEMHWKFYTTVMISSSHPSMNRALRLNGCDSRLPE